MTYDNYCGGAIYLLSNKQDRVYPEEQKCPTCSHEIVTKGYCDYCAMEIKK